MSATPDDELDALSEVQTETRYERDPDANGELRPPQAEASHVNLAARLTAPQPGDPGSAARHQERGVPALQLGFQFIQDEMLRGR